MKYRDIDRHLNVAKYHHNHSKDTNQERRWLETVKQDVNTLLINT